MGVTIYHNWTYSSEGPTCPYCTRIITPDDGSYYDEHRLRKLTCGGCGRDFDVAVNIHATWRTKKLDPTAMAP